LLKKAGVKREKIFITNVVKHRPPKNRKPKASEIRACLPYLEKQLSLINPAVVCTLGETALAALTKKRLRLRSVRGKLLLAGSRLLLPTYHPASVRYNKKARRSILVDLKKAASIARR
jgi:DNA polymerase